MSQLESKTQTPSRMPSHGLPIHPGLVASLIRRIESPSNSQPTSSHASSNALPGRLHLYSNSYGPLSSCVSIASDRIRSGRLSRDESRDVSSERNVSRGISFGTTSSVPFPGGEIQFGRLRGDDRSDVLRKKGMRGSEESNFVPRAPRRFVSFSGEDDDASVDEEQSEKPLLADHTAEVKIDRMKDEKRADEQEKAAASSIQVNGHARMPSNDSGKEMSDGSASLDGLEGITTRLVRTPEMKKPPEPTASRTGSEEKRRTSPFVRRGRSGGGGQHESTAIYGEGVRNRDVSFEQHTPTHKKGRHHQIIDFFERFTPTQPGAPIDDIKGTHIRKPNDEDSTSKSLTNGHHRHGHGLDFFERFGPGHRDPSLTEKTESHSASLNLRERQLMDFFARLTPEQPDHALPNTWHEEAARSYSHPRFDNNNLPYIPNDGSRQGPSSCYDRQPSPKPASALSEGALSHIPIRSPSLQPSFTITRRSPSPQTPLPLPMGNDIYRFCAICSAPSGAHRMCSLCYHRLCKGCRTRLFSADHDDRRSVQRASEGLLDVESVVSMQSSVIKFPEYERAYEPAAGSASSGEKGPHGAMIPLQTLIRERSVRGGEAGREEQGAEAAGQTRSASEARLRSLLEPPTPPKKTSFMSLRARRERKSSGGGGGFWRVFRRNKRSETAPAEGEARLAIKRGRA